MGVKNRGACPAAASVLKFYLSADSTLDRNDTTIGDVSVPSLPAGQVHTATESFDIPPVTRIGRYYLLVKTDADGTVSEANETNNTKAIAIDVP